MLHGKTTLTLHAIAECQKAGGIAAFIDAEHAFDMIHLKLLVKMLKMVKQLYHHVMHFFNFMLLKINYHVNYIKEVLTFF